MRLRPSKFLIDPPHALDESVAVQYPCIIWVAFIPVILWKVRMRGNTVLRMHRNAPYFSQPRLIQPRPPPYRLDDTPFQPFLTSHYPVVVVVIALSGASRTRNTPTTCDQIHRQPSPPGSLPRPPRLCRAQQRRLLLRPLPLRFPPLHDVRVEHRLVPLARRRRDRRGPPGFHAEAVEVCIL